MRKIIAKGAEATIIFSNNRIIKHRVPKKYRLEQIDERLRKTRTKKEAKIIDSLPIPCPKLINVDLESMEIEMEYIKGKRLADIFEHLEHNAVAKEIGKKVKMLHDKNIIHGDLTTSNMILGDQLYFIDFGLSFSSNKLEDKAVDLHLLRQALESKHYRIWKECFDVILSSYNDKQVISRLEQVEGRGRNKSKQITKNI
jgi:TP53 regulating kinase-like protein